MRALARLLLIGAAVLIVATLAASRQASPAPVPPTATVTATTTAVPITRVVPAEGGVYIEGLVGRSRILNPLAAPANQPDEDVASLVFSGLTRRDDNGHIVPDLAERWQVSADTTMYTFTLRMGLLWHDGEPVTADDVVYTIQALQSDEFSPAPWLMDLWKGVSAIKLDRQTVRLTLPQPYAPFLQYTTLGLLPAHILAGRGDAGRDVYDTLPLGTGPYRLRERSDERIVLEAFSGYRGPTPMIPRLEFRYFADTPAAIAALRAGKVSAVADLTLDQAESLEKETGIRVYWARRASQTLIVFNLSLPFFDDSSVRRALQMAIDRQALVQTALNGKATVSQGIYLSTSWVNSAPPKAGTADMYAAESLLAGAGWIDSDKDGVREKNGVKFEFGLLTSDDPARVRVAEEIARAWTRLGAAVEVQVTTPQALLQDYLKPRRFEAVLVGVVGIPDDPDPYEMWHSSQRGADGLNFSGFASQPADEILEEARRSGDTARRKELYAQFQDILTDQVPAIVLYEPMFAFAVSNKVQAVRLSSITEPGDRFRHLSEWYMTTRTVTMPN